MKTLIVAFDGLDYELIKKYNCKNIMQKEFGKIDNNTGISQRMTSELFASFITGKTWREHGIKGLTLSGKSDFSNKLRKILPLKLIRFLIKIRDKFGLEKRYYQKDDLKTKTIFDKIKNSKALNVPSLDPNFCLDWKKHMTEGFKKAEEKLKIQFLRRKGKFNSKIKKDYKLLMTYFFFPDGMQHLYYDAVKKENKIKNLYKKMNNFAEKIKKKAKENGYEWVLFMSDHGLPEGKEHNKNAFYSSNIKLKLKNPKITQFHSIILKMVKKE